MTKAGFYRNARTDLPGPLAGVKVIEVATTWAGPICCAVLADLGADVIKLETPTGEVGRRLPPFLPGTKVSFMHATANRNKRSLSLDLRQPEARDIFLKLIARSDLIVENLTPGVMDGYGAGYEAARAVKPDIIYVSISGWGQFGPYRERVAYDPLAQAASGFMSLNGDPGGIPTKAPTYLADDLGGMHGAIGALAALRHRERTGEGQHVDVAMLDSLLFQSNGLLTLAAMGVEPTRMGNQFGLAVPANVYSCRDGRVYAGVLLDSQWKAVAGIIGHPELAEDPQFATLMGRAAHREACDALLASWLAEHSQEEAIAALSSHGVPIAPVSSYTQVAHDPHVAERDMLKPTRLEDGSEAPITGPAAKFSRTPTTVRTGAPALGQHNEEILAELGLDAGARAKLKAAGVI